MSGGSFSTIRHTATPQSLDAGRVGGNPGLRIIDQYDWLELTIGRFLARPRHLSGITEYVLVGSEECRDEEVEAEVNAFRRALEQLGENLNQQINSDLPRAMVLMSLNVLLELTLPDPEEHAKDYQMRGGMLQISGWGLKRDQSWPLREVMSGPNAQAYFSQLRETLLAQCEDSAQGGEGGGDNGQPARRISNDYTPPEPAATKISEWLGLGESLNPQLRARREVAEGAQALRNWLGKSGDGIMVGRWTMWSYLIMVAIFAGAAILLIVRTVQLKHEATAVAQAADKRIGQAESAAEGSKQGVEARHRQEISAERARLSQAEQKIEELSMDLFEFEAARDRTIAKAVLAEKENYRALQARTAELEKRTTTDLTTIQTLQSQNKSLYDRLNEETRARTQASVQVETWRLKYEELERKIAAGGTQPRARPPLNQGDGLNATYFVDEKFGGPLPYDRPDEEIKFIWRTFVKQEQTQKHPLQKTENFSIRWIGFIQAPSTGEFTFHVFADDWAVLTIAGDILIRKPENPPTWDREGKTRLEEGKFYQITVEYVQLQGEAKMKLEWKTPTTDMAPIPKAHLYRQLPPGATASQPQRNP